LDLTGLLGDIYDSANRIDIGRKGLAIDGEEHNGRLNYEYGISRALDSFQKAQVSKDPKTLILAEHAFLTRELQFCGESDTITRNSLIQALHSFDDAFLSLEAVEDPGYKIADKTYPHRRENRIAGFPKDAADFSPIHYACAAHRTRISNILRSPGINVIEKTVLRQRSDNLRSAQESYIEKQKKALGA
jgi:hypothetical protein